MTPFLSRRRFLQSAVTVAVGPLAVSARAIPAAAGPEDPAGLSTYQLGPQIWIRWDNRVVTCYRAHRSQKYPYLYPLTGPVSGLSLTSETTLPYPHHRSLYFACDRVNGANFWQEGFDQGQILSRGPRLGQMTKNAVEITDTCDWQRPEGPVVMRDERRIVVTIAGPRLRFVDCEIRWQAVQDVTIQKTNHSLFAARAALDLTPLGGGRLLNAEGASGEKGTFGKTSPWCAFVGRRATETGALVEGLAILTHPKNPWAPCPWFTRDYGFMSPTPFNWLTQPWTLPAGQSVTLRYRVVLHAGDTQEAGLEAIYRAWAAS